MQGKPGAIGIIFSSHRYFRCAGLAVPGSKTLQINPVGIRHRGLKVIAGHSLAIVAFKIELHTLLEALFTEQCMVHTDDRGSLLINGHRIEVIDFNILIWTDRV